MRRRHAFTLVELLVVIGIIAVLVSILLPALGRAKWQAQVTQCSARMRDVVLAVQMYANDNKGYIPPIATDNGRADWNMLKVAGKAAPTDGDTLNVMYQQSDIKGATKWDNKDSGALMGRLYRTRYLKTTKTFACPSSKWPFDATNPKTGEDLRNFGFYVLNFHMAFKDQASTILQPWWKRLPNYGKVTGVTKWSIPAYPQPEFRKAILGEPMFSKNVDGGGNPADDLLYITHASGKRRAFNMAYPDGSVLTYFDNNFASRPVDRMSRYLELANAIQHNLDGGTVNFSVSGWNSKGYASIPTVP